MKTILCPIDFSALSKNVLRGALAHAETMNARLIVLNVREPQEVVEGEFGMLPPEPEPADEVILADVAAQVPPHPTVEVEAMVARGLAAEEIVRVATERRCDLIMLGSHEDDGFFARLFHADVTAQVKKDAPCPVVSISSEPEFQSNEVT